MVATKKINPPVNTTEGLTVSPPRNLLDSIIKTKLSLKRRGEPFGDYTSSLLNKTKVLSKVFYLPLFADERTVISAVFVSFEILGTVTVTLLSAYLSS